MAMLISVEKLKFRGKRKMYGGTGDTGHRLTALIDIQLLFLLLLLLLLQ